MSIKSPVSVVKLGSSEENSSRKLEVGDENSSSSGTLEFSKRRDDSNQLSGSSDIEDIDDDIKAEVDHNYDKSTVDSPKISSSDTVGLEGCEDEAEAPGLCIRPPAVDFHDFTQHEITSDESDHFRSVVIVEIPVVPNEVKGLCHQCNSKQGSLYCLWF